MKIDFKTHAMTLIHEAAQAMIFGELMADEPLDEGDMGHSQVYEFKGKRFIIEGYINGSKLVIQEV